MAKPSTNFTNPSENTTDYTGSSTAGNAIKLNDTAVKLNSLVITLTGFIAGFYPSTKIDTDYAHGTKVSTGFTNPAKNTTTYSGALVTAGDLVVQAGSLTVNALGYGLATNTTNWSAP